VGERAAEVVAVACVLTCGSAVESHHVDGCLCADTVQVDVLGATLDGDHVLLAVVAGDAVLVVVLEERVQTGSVDQDVVAGHDAQTPTLVARRAEVLRRAGREVWILEGVLLHGKRNESGWVGLPVWSLGLNVAHEDVLGVQELVVVQDRVLV